MKICTKCKTEKELGFFYKSKSNPDGKGYYCKGCLSANLRLYRLNNKERIKEIDKKSREKNKEKIKERKARHYINNLVMEKQKQKLYRGRSKEKIRKRMTNYYKDREGFDFDFKLRRRISGRIRMALKKHSKNSSTIELLGCSIGEVRAYLESQFKGGMCWLNHGLFGWHIDHIRPCSSFDLTDPAQQKICFHYTNLQPLWVEDNLSKSDKVNSLSSYQCKPSQSLEFQAR